MFRRNGHGSRRTQTNTICDKNNTPWAKTIKKNTNSTQNKSQTHRAEQYEVTSFLSTDCELSTETCSKTFIVLAPCFYTRSAGKECT